MGGLFSVEYNLEIGKIRFRESAEKGDVLAGKKILSRFPVMKRKLLIMKEIHSNTH